MNSMIIKEVECCEKCFKWGNKYGEYVHPCNEPDCECHLTTDKNMKKEKITDNLYHSLGYDWDAELNELSGKDLWDTPNEHSRKVRKMVIYECERIVDRIQKLPFYKRLFNLF